LIIPLYCGTDNDHNLVLDLFLSPRLVYLSWKRETNKDTLVGLAISNSDAEVKGAFEVIKELSGLVLPKAIVNKGYNIIFCLNELANKCVLCLLGVFWAIKLKDIILWEV